MDILVSNSPDEQLIGARILGQVFYLPAVFRRYRSKDWYFSVSVVERLVEMLNWTGHKDEQIRLSAAKTFIKTIWYEAELSRDSRDTGSFGIDIMSRNIAFCRNLIPRF
ncbi:hypothetical protein TSUD_196540 [Trifolium subterraneum]|nr:hypothetical protein TSUD_196540 [Trifolium subterraneum]